MLEKKGPTDSLVGFTGYFTKTKILKNVKKKLNFFWTFKGQIRPLLMKFYPFKDPTSNFEPHSYDNF